MKPILVNITKDISTIDQIKSLQQRIPNNIYYSDEYLKILPQIKLCIEDFNKKLIKLGNEGSTIQIEKSFELNELTIKIILKYPKKIEIFGKLRELI